MQIVILAILLLCASCGAQKLTLFSSSTCADSNTIGFATVPRQCMGMYHLAQSGSVKYNCDGTSMNFQSFATQNCSEAPWGMTMLGNSSCVRVSTGIEVYRKVSCDTIIVKPNNTGSAQVMYYLKYVANKLN